MGLSTACDQLTGGTAIPADVNLNNMDDSISYALGVDIARTIQDKGIEINPEVISRAMIDVIEGKASFKMEDNHIDKMLLAFQQRANAFQQEAFMEKARENQAAGDEFLEGNKDQEGVITLESGLQYKISEAGSGTSPLATDTVVVHYQGTLIGGDVFDSSYDRGEPVEFVVNEVIPGWTEALQLMKVGDKWTLYIPAHLGYGPRGAGNSIGPNEALVFEVELLEVKPRKGNS